MKKRKLGLGAIAGLVFGLLVVQHAVMPGLVQPPPVETPTFGNSSQPPPVKRASSVTQKPTSEVGAASPTPALHPESKPNVVPEPASGAAPDKLVIIDNKEYPLRTYKTLATPNDPSAGQWWVSNAKLDQAWDIPRGATSTVLAVIDTGFALNHEEFQNRWYVNAGESGVASSELASKLNCTDRGLAISASCNLVDENEDEIVDNETGSADYENPSRLNCTAQGKSLLKSCNRIDDDGNGYTDDVTGWDFINTDNSSQAGELNPAGSGTQHGTMVAGVAAATGNNAKGIAGADWGTKILPLQALDDDSYGNTRSVGRAINYAVARGVDVISLSLGSTLPDPYVEQAVKAATAAGIVVVAAAGNDACDCMLYPANYPEVVAVGALNASSQRASFSSWGENLDIVAPGTSITSSTWQSTNQTAAYASGLNGTSFSAPMVAGMMTRLLSQRSSATPLQLTAALTESTNRLSLAADAPHDNQLGFGTLDAYKASQRLSTPHDSSQLYSFAPVSKGDYLNSALPADAPGSYRAYQCESGTIGATAVYELIKGTTSFFTVSKSEASNALVNGYASTLFTYACLQQSHDTAQVVRSLNVFKEFRNTTALH